MTTQGRLVGAVTAGLLHGAVMIVSVELPTPPVNPVVQLAFAPPPEPVEPPPTPPPEPVVEQRPEPDPTPLPAPARKRKRVQEPSPPEEAAAPEAPPDPGPPPLQAPPIPSTATAPAGPKVAAPRRAGRGHADMQAYGRGVHGSIMGQRRYPATARRLGLEGTAKVKLVIDRAGKLHGRPRLAQSSGHAILDEEALAMVERSAPFPALPPEFEKDTATMVIPVRFDLR